MANMPLFTSSAVNPINTKILMRISDNFYHKIGTSNDVNNATSTTAMRFNGNPTFAILFVLTLPPERTIALAGVLVGRMNPKLAAIATGIISNNGLISKTLASAAEIGINKAAVAVLLMNSKNTTMNTNTRSITK
jgi:hypothetical protein